MNVPKNYVRIISGSEHENILLPYCGIDCIIERVNYFILFGILYWYVGFFALEYISFLASKSCFQF
jgi:hypothetical protein